MGDYICPKCFKYYPQSETHVCGLRMPNTKKRSEDAIGGVSRHTGWICPECGCVYSPSTSECFKCNGPVQVTC